MTLVMVDLLGYLPRPVKGVLVGVATGIKLTPGVFIVFLLITRRSREAVVAAATTVGTIILGWLMMPQATVAFWTDYIFDPGRPGPAQYISNQALRGAVARWMGGAEQAVGVWLPLALIVACCGLLVARLLHHRGRQLEALVAEGFTGLLVSPISWSNHWVWALPAIARVISWGLRHGWTARLAGCVWGVVFLFGLPWWAPNTADKEFHLTGWQTVIGNSYALATIAFLLVAACEGRSRANTATVAVW